MGLWVQWVIGFCVISGGGSWLCIEVEVGWFRLPVVQDSVMGGWRGIGVV